MTMVIFATSAAAAPMAAHTGSRITPTTPMVTGISSNVLPDFVLQDNAANVAFMQYFLHEIDHLLARDAEFLRVRGLLGFWVSVCGSRLAELFVRRS